MANEERMETVAGAIAEFAQRGFDVHFRVDDGRLHAIETGRAYEPAQVVIRDSRRFEGVSDPSDTSVVYAIEAGDGTRGTLVDAYNVYADPAVAEFLRRVRVDRPSIQAPRPVHLPFEQPGPAAPVPGVGGLGLARVRKLLGHPAATALLVLGAAAVVAGPLIALWSRARAGSDRRG